MNGIDFGDDTLWNILENEIDSKSDAPQNLKAVIHSRNIFLC